MLLRCCYPPVHVVSRRGLSVSEEQKGQRLDKNSSVSATKSNELCALTASAMKNEPLGTNRAMHSARAGSRRRAHNNAARHIRSCTGSKMLGAADIKNSAACELHYFTFGIANRRYFNHRSNGNPIIERDHCAVHCRGVR